MMAEAQQLEKLRPLGQLERISASCHHLGFFNNVGLTVHYRLCASSPAIVDLRRLIYLATGDVIRKHRILSAIAVNEERPDSYFASLPAIDLDRSIIFLRRSQPFAVGSGSEEEDQELDAILEAQHNTSFKTDYGILPFWRLVILQSLGVETEFMASFICHHAIGDGVSGFVFHQEFRDALQVASASYSADLKVNETCLPDMEVHILPPLEELHPLPINPNTSSPPTANLKEWTGSPIHTPCKSRWKALYVSQTSSKVFFQDCKAKGLSVTSALCSTIAMALFSNLPTTAAALTCIVPVNLRPWLSLPPEAVDSAIGTYFDAMRVKFTQPDQRFHDPTSTNVWPAAEHVSAVMKEYLQNVSPSGEPYTAVAVFNSIPDVSAIFRSMIGRSRDAAFEVTNVGVFSPCFSAKIEDAASWQTGRVLLSRSSVVAGAAVTVSVATGENDSMTLGFSWQEGVVEAELVDHIIRWVKKYFENYQ